MRHRGSVWFGVFLCLGVGCGGAADGAEDPDVLASTPDGPHVLGGALCIAPTRGWLVSGGQEGDDLEALLAETTERLEAWAPHVYVECHGPESWLLSPDLGLHEALSRAEGDAGPGGIFSWDGQRLLAGATYELQVDVTWSEQTHPGRSPPPEVFPHLSWIGGGTHADGASFWAVDTMGSPGMRTMALGGNTEPFETELEAERGDGAVARTFRWEGLGFGDPPGSRGNGFFAPSTTRGTFIDVLASHPRVTLVTMLGPSPDWFVGTPPGGLVLTDSEGWRGDVVHDLRPLGGGVRDLNPANPWNLLPCDDDPSLCQVFTDPPGPLSWIEADSYLGDASVGSFSLLPLSVPEPLVPSPAQAAALLEVFGG